MRRKFKEYEEQDKMNLRNCLISVFIFCMFIVALSSMSYATRFGTLDTISSEKVDNYHNTYNCYEGCYIELGYSITIETQTDSMGISLAKVNETGAKLILLTQEDSISGTKIKNLIVSEGETYYVEDEHVSLEILETESNRIIFKTTNSNPIRCEETDLGDNRFIRGTTTITLGNGENIVKTDFCESAHEIVENYCTKNNHIESYNLGIDEIGFREIKMPEVNYSYELNPALYSGAMKSCYGKNICEFSWNISKSIGSKYSFSFYADDDTGHHVNKTLTIEVVNSMNPDCHELENDECLDYDKCSMSECGCIDLNDECKLEVESEIEVETDRIPEPKMIRGIELSQEECSDSNDCLWSEECDCLDIGEETETNMKNRGVIGKVVSSIVRFLIAWF